MRALPSMGYAAVARNVSWKEHARETRFDFFEFSFENRKLAEELPAPVPCPWAPWAP
jgi:hypothetical protein